MRTLCVKVENAKLFAEVVRILKSRNIPFRSDVTRDCTVILTDSLKYAEEFSSKYGIPIILTSKNDLLGKIELAILSLKGKITYESLVIGLDPGKTIGYALIGDDELLEVKSFNDVLTLKEHLDLIVRTYPYKRMIIRVGSGEFSSEVLENILDLVERYNHKEHVSIEIVDESSTSKSEPKIKSNIKIPKRSMAAVNIALRKGIPVHVR